MSSLNDASGGGGSVFRPLKAVLDVVRGVVSLEKRRFRGAGYDLDLTYITPRVIAMGFPSQGGEGLFRNPLPEVQRFLETHHAGRYRVYNLCSERSYDPAVFGGAVARFPFNDHCPCPLAMLPGMCADMSSWLRGHPERVIAVHCKAGKGRTGLAIAAFLLHCGFCEHAEAALAWFGDARTSNGRGVTIPSQQRYVHYYEQILRRGFPATHTYAVDLVRLRGVPSCDLVGGGSCVPWFTLSCDGLCVFDWRRVVGGFGGGSSARRRLTRYRRGEPFVDFACAGLDIRIAANVKLQLLHEGGPVLGSQRVCSLVFHTAFIERPFLVFSRAAIDGASAESNTAFPPAFAIEIYLHRVAAPPLAPLEGGGKGSGGGGGGGGDAAGEAGERATPEGGEGASAVAGGRRRASSLGRLFGGV